MSAFLSGAAQLAGAMVLLYAGCQKLAAPREFRGTLSALRVPHPQVVAAALPLAEIAVAAMLLTVPSRLVTAVGVGMLGVAFAGAGVVALARRAQIACACFGPGGAGRLGVRQLAYLPLWLGLAVLIVMDQTAVRGEQGLLLLLAEALSLAVAGLVVLARAADNWSFSRAALPWRQR